MRAFLTAIALACALPGIAAARCTGTDLIDTLPDDQRAALEAAAAATPYPEGLLWQATKDETEITFFGTYHFEHPRTTAHLEALTPHIDAAQTVYLEVSNADQSRLQAKLAAEPSIMFITDGPTLPDLLGDEDWQALSEQLSLRGLPSFMVAKFKPIWASMMLGIGPCEARSGAMERDGIDHLIGAYAEEIGTPSKSLEDAVTVLTLLDDIPQEDQLGAIRMFLDWDGDPDDVAYTLRERYLAGQTALIWEYSRLISLSDGGTDAAQSFAQFEGLLLDQRNRDWVDLLDSPEVGGRVFVGAGAAHLPGEMGVLRLLEDRGWTIAPLPFDP